MKKLFNAASGSQGKYYAVNHLVNAATRYATLFFGSMILICFLFSGCEKEHGNTDGKEDQDMNTGDMYSEANVINNYKCSSPQTAWELLQARSATARYRNIKHATDDGYADISVVVPNMGYHYMKSALVDAKFEIRKPEILVYNKKENGRFELVAVEYAIPLSASPNIAPAGFTGDDDVWDRNTVFDKWLLHAWVWQFNPNGVFNPINPLVHVH